MTSTRSKLTERKRPRSIPSNATVRHAAQWGSPSKYYVEGRLVACVSWHDNGQPAWVWHYDSKRRKHGVERYYFESGRIQWETRHVHGLQHGLQRQWTERGRLLCETRFVRGTGRDLWWGDGARRLTELRELVNGQRHGVEQYWDDARTVHTESRYYEGLEHGISREWDGRRLCAGFPKFHIHGKRVTRKHYERAAISDPTLVPYLLAEDRPARRCPIPPWGTTRGRIES